VGASPRSKRLCRKLPALLARFVFLLLRFLQLFYTIVNCARLRSLNSSGRTPIV